MDRYYQCVQRDIEEAKQYYPYIHVIMLPTVEPTVIKLRVTAVSSRVLSILHATEDDFLNDYSRELSIIVPYDYQTQGCEVWGGRWINRHSIPMEDQHFHENDGTLLRFCVGVPSSFALMHNVILENIRTADNMLSAYEAYLTGKTTKIELIAYSHGEKGKVEYEQDKKRYKSPKQQ